MNILAENYDQFNIGSPGVWHTMLPRNTSYAVYLPLLCLFRLKQSRKWSSSKTTVMTVLPSSMEVSYVKQRDDIYHKDISLTSRANIARVLSSTKLSEFFFAQYAYWFVDTFDLLEGGESDALLVLLFERMAEWKVSRRVRTFPYILIVHSASSSAVLERYPEFADNTIPILVPPPRNKINVIVRAPQTFVQGLMYVHMQLLNRMLKTGHGGKFNKVGDCLIVTRTEEDAFFAHNFINKKVVKSSLNIDMRLLGYLLQTLGIIKDASKRQFKL